MRFDTWLKKNEQLIDWNLFLEPWDAMQMKHNPFREEQIRALLIASSFQNMESPLVLDLGCGPGVLGRLLTNAKPLARYYGMDGDPLMLAAMRRLLDGRRVHSLQFDLRKTEWRNEYTGHFDSVVSLTALHWLSQPHLKATYLAAFEVLKPGGTFMVGDPYLPEDPQEQKKLEALHNECAASLKGPTWSDYWKSFLGKYQIEEMYTEYHKERGYQIPFEGSDAGYTLNWHLETLQDVGFNEVSVFWKEDLRAVFGGTRPVS